MSDGREPGDDGSRQLVELPGGESPTSRFLTDEHWAALERVLPPPDGNNLGQAEADRREFAEALLWMAHRGCGWAGLPADRWNAESLRQKRIRWRRRGWLSLLQNAAPRVGLPSWLVPIAVLAFDPGAMSRATYRGASDTDAEEAADGHSVTSRVTSALVTDVASDATRLVRPLLREENARQAAERGARQGVTAGAYAPTVALDQATIDALARRLGEAIGSAAGGAGGRAGRGRGRSELAVVWGDVPSWAKGGFAVVIALFTSVLMAPAYLHGMSPFAGDLRDSFNLPMWAATLVVVFGPPIFVLLVLWVVYLLVQREQARERASLERGSFGERAP